MHELGIMIEIVRTVEKIAEEHKLTRIDALVLQVGRDSPVVPGYLKACYPAAVDGTRMADTRLEIEILEGKDFLIKELIAY